MKKLSIFSLLLIACISFSQAQDVSTGLLAHYKFAGNATDASGNGHNGSVISNVTSTTDRFNNTGGAYNFNNGYINLGSNINLSSTTNTFSFWLKSNLLNNGFVLENYNWLVDKGIAFVFDNDGKIRVSGRNGNNTYYSAISGETNLFNNSWHHVVGVISGNTWYLYINGELASSNTYTYTTSNYNTNVNFIVGNYFHNNVNQNRYYRGVLDDLRIYNRALNPTEVAMLYNMESDGIGGDKLPEEEPGEWLATGNAIYYNAGNVGINTDNPTEKLHVNGNILASEVKISVDADNVPDYVFKEGYELPTLQFLKAYLEKYSHLPEVPSAKEMETDGMKVGEMNLLLLKKIEELSLYIIKQNKQLEALEVSNSKQMQLIDELKARE